MDVHTTNKTATAANRSSSLPGSSTSQGGATDADGVAGADASKGGAVDRDPGASGDGAGRRVGRGRRRRVALAAGAAGAVLLLASCARSDRSEIVTWTDEHGRACTGVAVIDSEDNDREVTSIDCDYPPAGKTPGRTASTPLPH